MTIEEIVARANVIVAPYGLKAEILKGIHSVGVGGDNRTYTPVICLKGKFPGWDVLATLSTEISNALPINRVTFETAVKPQK